LFVTRGNGGATASDPVKNTGNTEVLSASNPKILSSVIGENEVHLYRSPEQHGNWLDCIKSRQATVAPVEVAHRSTSACLLHHIAMKLKRKVYWEPAKERFKNDDEANRLLSRSMRAPYLIE
jgi:myo-inositol 2-dehydrogenase / D-chiro-inositol 1-dehydrogenase